MFRRAVFCLSAILVALSIIQIGLASSGGADPGHSGGHLGGGWNCTACHQPFNAGPGGVELLGAPQRYVPNAVYDLEVRVFDAEQAGAGFQISAESALGHQGLFIISDPTNTQYSDNGGDSDYVTHKQDGVDDSLATWAANGGSYSYFFRWVAPGVDAGPVTFFTAGNAVNDGNAFFEDRYYATYAVAHHANAPDADGDEDVDLFDYAAYQRCFDADDPATPPSCEFVDVDMQSFLTSFAGPTAVLPAGYVLADPVRGGLLYDKWWAVNGSPTPTGNHPLYPAVGQQSGNSTYRCKECHGWDYKGADGAYASGSHYTGIPGVFGTALSPQELFDLLKADQNEDPDGHDMDAFGMTDADIWDVVKMTFDRMILTDDYIDQDGMFLSNPAAGTTGFNDGCATCHGFNGDEINFGTVAAPEYIGGLARRNPWEFLHKTRFGHPASPMPASELLLWTALQAADVGAYSATLNLP